MKRFKYESYTEWYDNQYQTVTKIYAEIPQEAMQAIAKAENWDGCHWDALYVVWSEQVEGQTMSDDALTMIKLLGATHCEESEEE